MTSPQKGLLVSAGSEGTATGRVSFQHREATLFWSARLAKRYARVSWCESSVSLGSTRINKLLATQCSNSSKRLLLELDGNSPFIVFDDGKLETAVEACILAKFKNSGLRVASSCRMASTKGSPMR